MSAAAVVKQLRQAEKMLTAGVEMPPLELDPAALAVLGVPPDRIGDVTRWTAKEQLRALRPLVERYNRGIKRGRVAAARDVGQRLADQLVQTAERVEAGVVISPEILADLANLAGLDAVQLADRRAIVLPRLLLRRALSSLAGTSVRAILTPAGLRLSYRTARLHGEMRLVGVQAARGEAVVVPLQGVGMPIAKTIVQIHPEPSAIRRDPAPAPGCFRLLEAVLVALGDLLAA